MKKIFISVAILALVFVFTGCTNNSSTKKASDNELTSIEMDFTDDNELTSSDSITYKSKKYKFEFTMPDSWQGYRIIQEDSDKYDPERLSPLQYFYFYYPTAEENVADVDGYYPVFVITVWELKNLVEGTKILDEISRNDSYVFSSDIDEVTAGLPDDISQEVVDGIVDIVESFK